MDMQGTDHSSVRGEIHRRTINLSPRTVEPAALSSEPLIDGSFLALAHLLGDIAFGMNSPSREAGSAEQSQLNSGESR